MDDRASFGVIADRLGFQIHRLDVDAMNRLTDQLGKHGVTPARATALFYVSLHEGCDQMALGRALDINRASTMKAVNELVELGVLERLPGRDRRSNALYLTEAGKVLVQKIERITARHDQQVFGALDDDERLELKRLLAKIRRA